MTKIYYKTVVHVFINFIKKINKNNNISITFDFK